MIEHHTPRTRDLGQEIDDLSTLLAALLTGLRGIAENESFAWKAVVRGDLMQLLRAVDDAHADLPTDEAAAEVREAAPSLAQAEAYYRAMAEQAKREAGSGSRAVVGDRTMYLDSTDGMLDAPGSGTVYMRPAEAEAYLAWRRSVTGPLRFQSGPLAALMVAITEAES